MKRLLAALAALLMAAIPVKAAASISINEPGPYAAFETVTLDVTAGKLRGYEYPVVIIRCHSAATGDIVWTYFRRWDGGGIPNESGPEPVVLGGDPNNTSIVWNSVGGDADCTVLLYAYGGLSHPNPRLIATGPTIHVTRP